MKPSRMLPLILAISLASHAAIAGGDGSAGNGGNSIICFDSQGKIKSAELLDLYEARVMHGIFPSMGAASISYEEKSEMALKRLERLSPLRATKYREWIADFGRDSLFLAGVTLVEVPDSDHIAVPAGCKRMQLIVQRAPNFPEDKRFTINKDIWDHLDNDSRAAAVLHEVIYREGFEENHHANSIASRYFNSIVVSDRLSSMTLEAFANVLVSLPMTDLGLPGYGVGSVLKPVTGHFVGVRDSEGNWLRPKFKPLPMTYYPGGNSMRTAWLSDTRKASTEPVYLGNELSNNKYILCSRGNGELTQAGFFADGSLKELYAQSYEFNSLGSERDSSLYEAFHSLVSFDAQGHLYSIQASGPPHGNYSHIILKNGKQATLKPDAVIPGTVYFNPDGTYARSSGKVNWEG